MNFLVVIMALFVALDCRSCSNIGLFRASLQVLAKSLGGGHGLPTG